ncbi:hypothetical protein J8273_4217 [Carpediemonas membranifera]|uniref:Uncharacterized protein n=1 Tax=Carpediemonas membranifera TaxID=201153 RepID=A0A8J6AUK0_9EUKA|nr:hypothetical protein J8273_4217 [Carpediemonas membranifera]|eukprot:KAG9394543.1 hypothetical protein J8273_4217 [Carpediemonas membranifera]
MFGNISLPTLSVETLTSETWRSFKRDAARIKALYPAAKLAVLLPNDLQDIIEDTLNVDLAKANDDKIDEYVSKFLAPVDKLSLVKELEAVTCQVSEKESPPFARTSARSQQFSLRPKTSKSPTRTRTKRNKKRTKKTFPPLRRTHVRSSFRGSAHPLSARSWTLNSRSILRGSHLPMHTS